MIKLTQKLITSIVTDEVKISDASFSFEKDANGVTVGVIKATLKRGTLDASGNFVENYVPLHVVVNSDGSFTSDDVYNEPAGAVPVDVLLGALQTQLEQVVGAFVSSY